MIRQWKKVVVVLSCVFAMCSTCMAADNMGGNPNFPAIGGVGGSIDYIDLSSCTFVYDHHDDYEFAANVIHLIRSLDGEKSVTDTWYFKQKKDGSNPLMFCNKSWVMIPKPRGIDYYGCIGTWVKRNMPIERNAFNHIYKQLWGVEYSW